MNTDAIQELASRLARDVFKQGDGPLPCKRIQFKGGRYPDGEINQGGFIESSLAACLEESLRKNLHPCLSVSIRG